MIQVKSRRDFLIIYCPHIPPGISAIFIFMCNLRPKFSSDCKYFNDAFNIILEIYAFPNGLYKKNNIKIALDQNIKHLLLVNNKISKIENNVHTRFGIESDSIDELKFKSIGGSFY